MLSRCNNTKCKHYKDYGGRGISVCKEWYTFDNFLADMGEQPKGLMIERKDVNGNYTLSNCCWATLHTQLRNKRNNVFLTLDDRTLCIADWEKVLGFRRGLVNVRLSYGWSVERALTTPNIHAHYKPRTKRN